MELTFTQTERGGAKDQMENVSSLIKKSLETKNNSGANPARILVHICTEGHVHTLRSQQKIIAEPNLLHKIGEVIGKENIKVVPVTKK